LATRNAIPVNVIRGFYSQTSGYDTTHDVFATINPLLDKARTYINDLGYLQSELYDIYYGEIEAFMNAADQSRFNVAGTASSPLPTAAAVGALVTQQEAIFRPTGGSGMLPSNVTSAVHGLVYGCLEGAQAGTYAGCNSDPTSAPAYQSALAALDNYAANARVLPMHFTPQGDARFYGNCSGLTSQTQVNMSLITEAQATALAPYIATDPDQCAWYGGGSCTGLDYPYYDATQSADACGLYGTRSCAILCIPPNGLFATAPQLGTGTIPPSPTGGAAYPPPSAAPAPQPLPQGMDPTAPAPDSDAGATCTDPPTCMSPSDCCSNSCTNGACDPVGGSDAGASDPDAADPDAGQ
jgi:hypothetical protein